MQLGDIPKVETNQRENKLRSHRSRNIKNLNVRYAEVISYS
jgi:hypothetical protein